MAQVMQQKLRILVLNHLADSPRAGYGLIKEIHEHTGWKPSYGSIYPLLDHLKKEGLVTVEEAGNKKVYHLTKEGKEAAKATKLDNKEAIDTMDQLHRLMLHLCGIQGEPLPVTDMMKQLMAPDQETKRIMRKSYAMKLEFARLMKNGGHRRNAERICAMMDEMTNELKRMR